jgi:2-amino-4-hydroxy-6-hydroxymethyldihydropteridine diphosphokinase
LPIARRIGMMRGMEIPSHKVCFSLGSNVGDRLANLRAAHKALQRYMTVTDLSPIYETAPAYVTDQPDFLNAALTGTTALEPQALLFTIKEIEREVGRQPTFRFGPRAIDIDILFYDALQVQSAELTIPHPGLPERAFILQPLVDIAEDWPHPVTGHTVRAMLDALPDQGGVRKIDDAF